MADFPRKIWSGLSRTRVSMDQTKVPDHADWLAIVNELQATQQYILNLCDNLESMPNVAEEVKEAEALIIKLQTKIEALVPPKDLEQRFDELKEDVQTYDVREECIRLKANLQKLFLRTQRLDSAFVSFRNSTVSELRTLENKLRNQFTKFESETNRKLAILEEKIKELQELVETPNI